MIDPKRWLNQLNTCFAWLSPNVIPGISFHHYQGYLYVQRAKNSPVASPAMDQIPKMKKKSKMIRFILTINDRNYKGLYLSSGTFYYSVERNVERSVSRKFRHGKL